MVSPVDKSSSQPISRPVRSDIAKGPIGNPKLNKASSTSQGIAPSRISLFASLCLCARILLPTNPGHTPTTAAILPIFFAIFIAVAKTDFEVFSPLTISRSLITLAGLKKCSPMTLSGLLVISAISLISSADVFVAKIASFFAMLSNSLKISFFNFIFSKTASIIISQFAKSLMFVEPLIRLVLFSTSSKVILPLFAVFS